MQVPIALDRRSRAPLQRQIYDAWRQGILAGRFPPGERVPSTRDLAAALGVSRTTVSAAYEQLMAEGYLQAERGSGTFVSRDLPDEGLPTRRATGAVGAGRGIPLSAYGARLEPARPHPPRAPGTIPLSTLIPAADLFPFPLWRRLVARQLRDLAPAVFQPLGHGAGHQGLREAIARYLGRSRAVRCTAEQIIVTSGSQQALDLCVRVLVDPGDEVAIENPCYQGARQLFTAHGAQLRPVPLDADGLVVHRLPDSARIVYTTPSHQFPTGVSLSLARRLELLDWARARRVAIIEDDYDSEYRYSGAPLPALQGLAQDVPVIYVGTFSNVMFSGLRIGYLVVPPALVETFVRAKWHTDRHTTLLEQAALADFLREGHLERHIRRMRRVYKRRRDVLVGALEATFGGGVTIAGEAAGMYLVVRFASNAVAERAKRRGVLMTSTEALYLTPPPAHEFILGFSALGERAIREGVRRLAT